MAISLGNIGKLYFLQKRYVEAEFLFQPALPIAEQSLGVEHPRTIKIREDYVLLREAMSGEAV